MYHSQINGVPFGTFLSTKLRIISDQRLYIVFMFHTIYHDIHLIRAYMSLNIQVANRELNIILTVLA